MSAVEKASKRWPALLLGVIGLFIVGALIWWVASEFSTPSQGRKKRAIQEISLLKPPPPPPPPKVEPPKVEPPPKMEVQEKLDVPKPDQQPDKPADAPPPGPDLGLDAKGGSGGDSFGLVGKKGAAELIGGGGGGGVGNRFAWYGALVKERIQDAVSKDKKLSQADYRIMVNVWISDSGAVTRAELIGSTGDAELDSGLKLAMRNLLPLREGAPGDMPQPIKLRITAR